MFISEVISAKLQAESDYDVEYCYDLVCDVGKRESS